MSSDIVFNDGGEVVTVLCDNLTVQGHDLVLDSSKRRSDDGHGHRRAIVHDQNDGLTINFGGDYPGGVTIVGVSQIIPRGVGGDLVVRGGISYEVLTWGSGDFEPGVIEHGRVVKHPTGSLFQKVTVSLSEVIHSLQTKVSSLEARVAALEAAAPHP